MINALSNVLNEADAMKIQDVSIPAISSGIFGFPVDRCIRLFHALNDLTLGASITFTIIEEYAKAGRSYPKSVTLLNIDDHTVKTFVNEFDRRFGVGQSEL